jgi:F420-non-reducing hydrogenase small subunit
MKSKVSTEWLSGCSGCHVAIVDLHEKLLNLADEVEFVRVPVLMDEKGYPEADIGIVEGAIRSEHDVEAVRHMRDSVRTLVAFGTCAVYGGPSGIGWLHGRESVFAEVYDNGPTNAGHERPGAGAPRLEDSVVPIDEAVQVDFLLPGCPPSPYFIAAGLKLLLDGSGPKLGKRTVCAGCTRKMSRRPGTALRKGATTAPDSELCLLSQGVVCMGSVTLDRCFSPCPRNGVACTGCNGPSIAMIKEPHLDFRATLADRMSLLTGTDAAGVKAYIECEAKTFYSYSMASPAIYKKPAVELREWAGDGCHRE